MAKKNREPTPEMVREVFSMLGKRGGPARAKALTRKQRREIASKAAQARWAKARKDRPRQERPRSRVFGFG